MDNDENDDCINADHQKVGDAFCYSVMRKDITPY
jgi:hypothetical protein